MQPYFQCASYKSFPNLKEIKILTRMQLSAVKHFHVLNVTMHSLERLVSNEPCYKMVRL